ncbi:hypothetical protein [uncultured Tenacibaculum sp.]|uniref:hypothetical protein n=1 Tax=uncultured Tenacibaculum sp. TaxID=174713 RepID=UPI0026062650|nr:hypothetical protein [uncultured Tenacibaculum sp.]
MKKKEIQDTLVTATALTVGSAGSRIIADKLPTDNIHLKRGGIVLTSVVGASAVGRKTPGKAFVQDIALGAAATQIGYWIKDAIGDKVQDNALATTALGNPVGSYDNPVQWRMGYVDLPKTDYTYQTDAQFVM